jgi:hypothetical protein
MSLDRALVLELRVLFLFHALPVTFPRGFSRALHFGQVLIVLDLLQFFFYSGHQLSPRKNEAGDWQPASFQFLRT